MPQPLHVANGTTVVSSIRAAGLPGDASVWADPLHDGPVPALGDIDALTRVRARHLAHALERVGLAQEPGASLATWVEADLRSARAKIAGGAHDELVLWYEHDLFDQLNLIQILSWLREEGTRVPVSLVSVHAFVQREGFKGIGELTPEDVSQLFAGRVRVSDEQMDTASRAWGVFRAPSPERFDEVRGDVGALPYLGAALGRFLEEYPWLSDGLSRTERRVLTLAAEGDAAIGTLLPQMHVGETAYYATDLTLLATALDLADAGLVSLTGDGTLARVLHLSDAGRDVLGGVRRHRDEGPWERWFGGVHVRMPDNRWWWDAAQQRPVHP